MRVPNLQRLLSHLSCFSLPAQSPAWTWRQPLVSALCCWSILGILLLHTQRVVVRRRRFEPVVSQSFHGLPAGKLNVTNGVQWKILLPGVGIIIGWSAKKIGLLYGVNTGRCLRCVHNFNWWTKKIEKKCVSYVCTILHLESTSNVAAESSS